jgi:hypothetical protein
MDRRDELFKEKMLDNVLPMDKISHQYRAHIVARSSGLAVGITQDV